MTDTAQTIFVVDDEPSILKALERLLRKVGYEVRSFSSSQAFLEQHDPTTPGCVILDIAMDEMDGLEIQSKLAGSGCDRPIVFLTGQGDIPTSVRAIKAGAVNFLTKPVAAAELLATIKIALEKDSAIRQVRADSEVVARRFASLTPRETQVFRYVVAGRLNKQIAADLGTVEKTIKVHRARVMEKLAVRTLADLVRLAEKAKVELPAGRF